MSIQEHHYCQYRNIIIVNTGTSLLSIEEQQALLSIQEQYYCLYRNSIIVYIGTALLSIPGVSNTRPNWQACAALFTIVKLNSFFKGGKIF